MKNLLFCMSILLLFPMVSTAQEVTVEFDEKVDFSNYMRYSWKLGTRAARDQVHQWIITAVDRSLQFKGRTPVSKDPNFHVLYHASSDKDVSVQSFGYTYGEVGGGEVKMVPLRVGSIVVDLIDSKDGKSFWRGTVAGALPVTGNVQNILRSKIEDLFRKFPPRK